MKPRTYHKRDYSDSNIRHPLEHYSVFKAPPEGVEAPLVEKASADMAKKESCLERFKSCFRGIRPR